VILERRRRDRRLDGARLREVEEVILLHGRLQRGALLDEVGHQLRECLRVHDRAREDVRADGRPLLDDRNLDFPERLPLALPGRDRLVVLGDEPREVQRAAQVRRPRAHEHHVHLDAFTFHLFHAPVTMP
jgi:hypothetical protein